eukprot:Gb_05189 [translate_table: standard]
MARMMPLPTALLLQPPCKNSVLPTIAQFSYVPFCLPRIPSKHLPRGSRIDELFRAFGHFSLPRRNSRVVMKAEENGTGIGSVGLAEGNGTRVGPVGTDVATLEQKEETPKSKRVSPLEKGGTLTGNEAMGKDPSPAALGMMSSSLSDSNGKFEDARWKNGTWNLQQFTKDGKVDWDAVIDAEVRRRKWLEDNPEASSNDEPVIFDTSMVPWWAWVKRFHLPEAELLNGRAAMVGFFMAYLVDSLTGVGLVDQMGNFFGKLLLFIAVVGVLLIRKNEDLVVLKQLVKESTFYDKQWQATWQDQTPDISAKE